MNAQQYWNALVEKNPNFAKEKIQIKSESIRQIVFQAHRRGQEYREATHNIFEEILGGKRK